MISKNTDTGATTISTRTEETTMTSPFLEGLEVIQDVLTERLATMPTEATMKGNAAAAPTSNMTDLNLFLTRLHQLQDWVEYDPALLLAIDTHISGHVLQQARKQMRQNVALAIVTTIIGAFLGWLLSAFVPTALLTHAFMK